MMIVLYLLAGIGAVVVGGVVLAIGQHIVRACRQGVRVAAVAARLHGRRKATVREWFFAARHEVFRSYSSLRIGVWEIPYDPRAPIRRSFYW